MDEKRYKACDDYRNADFFFTIPDRGILKGSYEIAIKSGMMENCKVTTNIEGILNVMGRKIPLNIHIKIEIEGTEN